MSPRALLPHVRSWQQYIDQSLLGTGTVAQAAIHGLDGNPWATSNGFSVSVVEASKLITGFNTPDGLYSGVVLAGEKFMFLRATEDEIQLKKGGEKGATISKSGKCMIIGVYDTNAGVEQNAGKCSTTVGKLKDYLVGNGF